MKALTLYQPWASLIADGRKTIETRPRPWHYVGPVAIHAGLKVDFEACKQFGYDPLTIPRGKVLCIVHMNVCVRFPQGYDAPDAYGDYTSGRFGYWLSDVMRLAEPIKARGFQGPWTWEPPDWLQVLKDGVPRSLPSECRA